MSTRINASSDRRIWMLNGLEVTRLCIDFTFTIHLWEGSRELTIIIEVPFTLRIDEHEQQLDPNAGTTLGPALQILHKPVESLTAYRHGRLVVAFVDGTTLDVDKDWQYESWHTFGSGELADIAMLCSPHDAAPWGDE